MQQRWFSSTDLTNFFNNKKLTIKSLISNTYIKNQTVSLFSHVPKTAGTSLENIIANNFSFADCLHVNAPDLNKLPQVIQLKNNLPQFISGHHPMHGLIYQLLSDLPLFHITMLRNPMDRVLSYYNYVKGKIDHPMHGFAAEHSLIQFLQQSPSPELYNGQSKRFSGYLHHGTASDQVLFSEAQDTLSHCFSLVLTTCLFDESLLLLQKRLGLSDIFYQRHNVSQKFLHEDELDDVTLNYIVEHNQADIQLFDWAKTACEALIKNELSSEEIATFKTNNQIWRGLIKS
jgi:hypothetical protein